MNSPTQIRDLDFSTPAFLRLRSFNDSWLLTNQVGGYIFLSREEFERLQAGELEDKDELYERLADADLISVDIDIDDMAEQMTSRRARLVHKPAFHRIVVTDKTEPGDDGEQMSIMMAEQVINLITETKSASISITFSGGDPFLNWPVIEHLIEGLNAVFEEQDIQPTYTIESNLGHVTHDHLDYMVEKGIGLSTILHGPGPLHDEMRAQHGGAPYALVRDILKSLRLAIQKSEESGPQNRIEASLAIGDKTSEYIDEIIGTYSDIGIDVISVEPPAAKSSAHQKEEYLRTYGEVLRAVLKSAVSGGELISGETATIARRVIEKVDAGPLFARFPTGPGVESLCIGPSGDIWTSEAGRRAAQVGQTLFHIGHTTGARYLELISHDVVRSMTVASVLEGHPGCVNCSYLPFCGISPEYNLLSQSSLAGRMLESGWCQFMLTLHDFVFGVLKDSMPDERKVLEHWAKQRLCNRFNL